MPIIMDVIGLVADFSAAVGMARHVARAERTLAAAGRSAELREEVRRIVGNDAATERIVRRSATQSAVAEHTAEVAAAIGRTTQTQATVEMAQAALQVPGERTEFLQWASHLASENRVCLLTEEAIRARFTGVQLDEALAVLRRVGPDAGGAYSKGLRVLFAQSNDPQIMAAALTHEAVHHLQSQAGRQITDFLAEFEAAMAQRQYWLAVGRPHTPSEYLWLINPDLDPVAREISRMYRQRYPRLAADYVIPAGFDSLSAARKILGEVRAALEAARSTP